MLRTRKAKFAVIPSPVESAEQMGTSSKSHEYP